MSYFTSGTINLPGTPISTRPLVPCSKCGKDAEPSHGVWAGAKFRCGVCYRLSTTRKALAKAGKEKRRK